MFCQCTFWTFDESFNTSFFYAASYGNIISLFYFTEGLIAIYCLAQGEIILCL